MMPKGMAVCPTLAIIWTAWPIACGGMPARIWVLATGWQVARHEGVISVAAISVAAGSVVETIADGAEAGPSMSAARVAGCSSGPKSPVTVGPLLLLLLLPPLPLLLLAGRRLLQETSSLGAATPLSAWVTPNTMGKKLFDKKCGVWAGPNQK